jgi:hypothetical protein
MYKHIWFYKDTSKCITLETGFALTLEEAIADYYQENDSCLNYIHTLVLNVDGTFKYIDIKDTILERALASRSSSQIINDILSDRADHMRRDI